MTKASYTVNIKLLLKVGYFYFRFVLKSYYAKCLINYKVKTVVILTEKIIILTLNDDPEHLFCKNYEYLDIKKD